jgi:L-glutamine-phosphate cytidylyltransferase
MNSLILAAGTGSRLSPYTDNCPKALVKLADKPLLQYQLDVFKNFGIKNIALVTGYLSEHFMPYNIRLFTNQQFRESNMLFSLMTAKELFEQEEDLIISYGDIIYERQVLEKLVKSEGEIVVSADSAWSSLWSLRMDDPLSDAESFLYNASNQKLLSLGKKISQFDEAQAQYIGLIKIKGSVLSSVLETYNQLPQVMTKNMYLTDFIMILIERSFDVRVSLHTRGWLEVDTSEDLNCYQSMLQDKLFDRLGYNPNL